MFNQKTATSIRPSANLRLGLALCLLAFGLLLAPAPSAQAANIAVTSAADGAPNAGNCPSASNCRLRDAIAKANPGDTIVFAVACCNTLTQGQFLINKNLTIQGSGAPGDIVIDANHASRAFDIGSGKTVTIDGLNISNGSAPAGQNGGGIRVQSGATLYLRNIVMQNNKTNNSGDEGGAIYNNGSLFITNFGFFSGNTSAGFGGAVSNAGMATVSGTFNSSGSRSIWFFDNHATIAGGAIYNSSAMTVTVVTISGGSAATFGGGIFNNDATMSIASSLITGNSAAGGAGIVNNMLSSTMDVTDSTISENTTTTDVAAGIQNIGTLTILRSTISGNKTHSNGGGIENLNTLTMINSTVSGNESKGDGGGIYNPGTLNLNNVTISKNTADSENDGAGDGGGIANISGTVNIKNSIIAANVDASSGTKRPDCSGALNSQGYNLLRINAGCTGLTDGVNGDLVGTSGSPRNAFLADLADNGGPTLTHALLASSPAINAGNPATPGSGGGACARLDQRGYPRGGAAGRCDMGAFERVFLQFLPLIVR
jgi:hypothetical protein